MTTIYDFSSIVIFAIMVLAFIFLTDRQPGTMSRLLVSGAAIAIANQLGNAGFDLLALALLLASAFYAVTIVRAHGA